MKPHLILIAIVTLSITTLHAQVPQLLSYQGRIAVGNTNFNSPPNGLFKFAFVQGAGPTLLWKNDGSVGNTEPAAAVSLTVTKGLYSVILGNTDITKGPVTAVMPPSIWANSDVRLRVWFSDGLTGFQLLSPDQRLAPNGYLPDGSVSSATIASDAITSPKIANGAVGDTELASGAVSSNKIAAGAVGPTQIAAGAISATQIAANTITGTQIANPLELGSAAADGTLRLWDAGTDVQTIRIEGGSGIVSTYGSDGLVQTELSGLSFGALHLYDNATANNRTMVLAAHEVGPAPFFLPGPGGVLRLSNAAQDEVYLKAHPSGGVFQLHQPDGTMTVQVKAAETSTQGGIVSLRAVDGIETVKIRGSGTSTTGGVINVSNSDGIETLRLNAEEGGAATMRIRNSSGANRIYMEGSETGTDGGQITLLNNINRETFILDGDAGTEGGAQLNMTDKNGNTRVTIEATEKVGEGASIYLRDTFGDVTISLDAEFGDNSPSRVTTGTVEITGGLDFAERFDVRAATGEPEPQPGMIVCIDPGYSGKLRPSTAAYDRMVAGIISGAGGIRPGVLMGQQDSVENGAYPVALAGRVYCYIDTADGGPIAPGDLITTSATPGHGMKATDYERARGAIIGKAMTSLEEGAGLVLVLVTLQ